MRTLIVSNRRDPFNGNLGDFASDPSLYFSWLRGAKRVQLDRIGAGIIPIPDLRNANIILGGGGLLETTLPLFRRGIDRILREADPDRVVVWGAGMNAHDMKHSSAPPYLDDFKLVGLRDAGWGHRWVPCASVMMKGVYRYKTTREAVVFDNWEFPWEENPGLPQMTNNRRLVPIPRFPVTASAARKRRALAEVLEFLGSAEVVLTSSYHGVLWGTLLGKKVVVTRPFSSKFSYFMHKPPVLQNGEDWREAAQRAIVYPNACEEYRALTCRFAEEVRAQFGL